MGANVVVLGLLKGLGTALAFSAEADAEEKKADRAARAAASDKKTEMAIALGKTHIQNGLNSPISFTRNQAMDLGFENPNALFPVKGYEPAVVQDSSLPGGGVSFYSTPDRKLSSDAYAGAVVNNLEQRRVDVSTGVPMLQPFLAETYYMFQQNKQTRGEDDPLTRKSAALYNQLKTQHISEIGTIINKQIQEAGNIAGEKGLAASPLIPSFKSDSGIMRAISVLPQAEVEEIFLESYNFAAGEAVLDLSKEYYIPTVDDLTLIRSKFGLATPAELFESITVQELRGGPISSKQIEEFKKQTNAQGFTGSDSTLSVNSKILLANQLAEKIPQIKNAEMGATLINVLGLMLAPEGNQRGILNVSQVGNEFDLFTDSTAPPIVYGDTTYDESYLRKIIPMFNDVEEVTGGQIRFVGRDLLIGVIASHLKKDLLETGTVGQMSRDATSQSGTFLSKLSIRKSFDGQTSNYATYNLKREQTNTAFTTLRNLEGLTRMAVQRQAGQLPANVQAPVFGFVGFLTLSLEGAKSQVKAAKNNLFVFKDEEDDKLFDYMASTYTRTSEGIPSVSSFLGPDGQVDITKLTSAQQTALLRFLAVQAVYQMARSLENPTGGGARLSERDIRNMEEAFQLGSMTDPEQFLAVINYAMKETKIRKRYLDSQAKYRSQPFHALANEVLNQREGNLIDFSQAQATNVTDPDNIFNYAVAQIQKDFKAGVGSPTAPDTLFDGDELDALNKELFGV